MQKDQQQTIRKRIKKDQLQLLQKTKHKNLFHQTFLPQQQKDLIKAINTIDLYRKIAAIQLRHQQRSIQTLDQDILEQYHQLKNRVTGAMDAIKENYHFLSSIIQCFKKNYQIQEIQLKQIKEGIAPQSILFMFHQMVRQWAYQGQQQRAYIKNITNLIKKYSNNSEKDLILVDGSMMGRILYQLKKQFKDNLIQGNQSNPQFFIFEQYLLYYCTQKTEIYPYVHNYSNHLKTIGPYRSFQIPQFEINIKQSQIFTTFGQIIEIYSSSQNKNKWNIIITCFKLDTINNIFKLIQCAYNILKDGGIWIDVSNGGFDHHTVPISYKEFIKIMDKSQFQILEQYQREEKVYQNPEGLIYDLKKIFYLVMRKKYCEN